jgi:hypothetical protein
MIYLIAGRLDFSLTHTNQRRADHSLLRAWRVGSMRISHAMPCEALHGLTTLPPLSPPAGAGGTPGEDQTLAELFTPSEDHPTKSSHCGATPVTLTTKLTTNSVNISPSGNLALHL